MKNKQELRDFQVGDHISIDWKKKCYEGKSVRRGVMDNLIEKCMGLPVTNLASEIIGQRYMLDSDCKKDLKLVKDFVNKKRHALPKIIKEKRDWIRLIAEIMDNFEYGIIMGAEIVPHHLSEICPSSISLIDRKVQLIRYTVMVVGKIDEDKDNDHQCVFQCELLDTCFTKIEL